jgi:nucleoid-associated protein YgaU
MAARIRARLTADPVTAGERIHVAVSDGRARLEGQTTSGLSSVRAEAITALTVGADRVDNQLEGPPPTRAERREGGRVPASVQAIRPTHTDSVEGYGANAPTSEPEVVEAAPSPETAAQASDDSAAGTERDDVDSPTASDSPAASSASPESRRYTVQVGDSLWNIAADFMGSGARWEELYEANRDVIGDDPMNLRAGIVITIPAD